ncbi:hypothetical protein BLNAU_5672 [Blattamonas nauphoetae]|uniref:C2H2-type domain-containing protein n=1 Tax=Blattamonas nauphoetae TaxID=2049346 RepID=A0ABQ9Y6P0_9EUKA|nr:hypothetical protein BLNAU_5672 [Blattamonas nauphoetae]
MEHLILSVLIPLFEVHPAILPTVALTSLHVHRKAPVAEQNPTLSLPTLKLSVFDGGTVSLLTKPLSVFHAFLQQYSTDESFSNLKSMLRFSPFYPLTTFSVGSVDLSRVGVVVRPLSVTVWGWDSVKMELKRGSSCSDSNEDEDERSEDREDSEPLRDEQPEDDPDRAEDQPEDEDSESGQDPLFDSTPVECEICHSFISFSLYAQHLHVHQSDAEFSFSPPPLPPHATPRRAPPQPQQTPTAIPAEYDEQGDFGWEYSNFLDDPYATPLWGGIMSTETVGLVDTPRQDRVISQHAELSCFFCKESLSPLNALQCSFCPSSAVSGHLLCWRKELLARSAVPPTQSGFSRRGGRFGVLHSVEGVCPRCAHQVSYSALLSNRTAARNEHRQQSSQTTHPQSVRRPLPLTNPKRFIMNDDDSDVSNTPFRIHSHPLTPQSALRQHIIGTPHDRGTMETAHSPILSQEEKEDEDFLSRIKTILEQRRLEAFHNTSQHSEAMEEEMGMLREEEEQTRCNIQTDTEPDPLPFDFGSLSPHITTPPQLALPRPRIVRNLHQDETSPDLSLPRQHPSQLDPDAIHHSPPPFDFDEAFEWNNPSFVAEPLPQELLAMLQTEEDGEAAEGRGEKRMRLEQPESILIDSSQEDVSQKDVECVVLSDNSDSEEEHLLEANSPQQAVSEHKPKSSSFFPTPIMTRINAYKLSGRTDANLFHISPLPSRTNILIPQTVPTSRERVVNVSRFIPSQALPLPVNDFDQPT